MRGFFHLLGLATLLIVLGTEGRAGDKAEKPVIRHLKFSPADPTITFRIGGMSKATTLANAAAVVELLGKEAKGLAAQVDFAKEKIVLISWTTSGPPDGSLKHEAKGAKIVFFVQAPAGAKVRGERARIGADFFAVLKDAVVTFEPRERP